MITAPLRHAIAPQIVIFEQGELAGLPGASAVLASPWVDTYRLVPEEVVIPQTGGQARSDTETVLGAGLTRRAGAYQLDLFTRQDNAAYNPISLQVLGQVAGGLIAGGPPSLVLYDFVVQADEVGDRAVPFTQSVRIDVRFCRVVWTMSASAPTSFTCSAVLRTP